MKNINLSQMSLIVPPEIKNAINKYSGYIDPQSPYAHKDLRGLFLSPVNRLYLARNLQALVTNRKFVVDHWPKDQPYSVQEASRYIATFKAVNFTVYINDIMESHPMPAPEDIAVSNPLQQLDHVNRDLLMQSANNLLQSPTSVAPDIYTIDPDTGSKDRPDYDYSAESFSDGTWHPEHLFTNSQHNRDNPYWKELEVNFDTDPDATGVGHRYANPLYTNQGKPTRGTGTSPRFGQFPGWQVTPHFRFHEKQIGETLREGGNSDRRVLQPGAYDMTALTRKPHYSRRQRP